MNEWYELINELKTDTPPLDEVSRARIEKKVRAALPRRRKRRWAAAVIAAALVLSACGYAAVTGQFSQWFWNRAADVQTPEASEDLLSSMGTVIGQSQTVDGVTMTLHGALWDRDTLMLSLSMDGAEMPTYYKSSGDSWLWFSDHQMETTIREAYPDLPDADLQKYMDAVRPFTGHPTIMYLYNWQTNSCYLQVQNNSITSQNDQDELTLHLENLEFGNTTLKGPFEFTFIVEKKSMELIYEGDVTMEPIEGVPIRVTKVTISPFYAEVSFVGLEPLPEEDGETDGGKDISPKLEALRINGLEAVGIVSGHGTSLKRETDGRWDGSTKAGPFHQVLDPATVEAIRVNDVWLELDQLELVQ